MTPHRQRLRAVITVYLSLTLLLVLALLCTLIESGRVHAMSAKLRSITFLSCDAVFSQFAQPLFNDYGVMFVWEKEEDMLAQLNEFIDGNLCTGDAPDLLFTDLYQMRRTDCSLSVAKHATDDGGRVFAEQVLEYMKYYLAEDAAERILAGIGLFHQGGQVSDFMDRIDSYRDTFTKVEDSVRRIRAKVDEVRALAQEPLTQLEELNDALRRFRQQADSASAADFSSALRKLRKSAREMTTALEDITEESENYYAHVEEAKGAVSSLEGELAASQEQYEEEVYEILDEQVDELKEKSADTDYDYYRVGANAEAADVALRDLARLKELTDALDEDLNTENAETYAEQIDAFTRQFRGFNLDGLGLNFDAEEVKKEDDGFLSSIKDLFEHGLLGFIAGDVSEKKLEAEDLPSAGQASASPEEMVSDTSSLLAATSDRAIFGEYIQQHFGRFTKPKEETALDYEAEYILAGKNSDAANLSAVVTSLVLLRTGCNLISLLSDAGKKAEAYALATSLVGFTGMPILIKVVQLVVIGVWSLAESIADAKALLAGHKVETIKDGTDWYISIEGLKNFGSDQLSPSGSDKGIGYEGYLRLLLMMQKSEAQYFRTMDMIQADLCKRENPAFRMSGCVSAVQVLATYEAPQLFVLLPFVSSQIEGAGGSWKFPVAQNYSY